MVPNDKVSYAIKVYLEFPIVELIIIVKEGRLKVYERKNSMKYYF